MKTKIIYEDEEIIIGRKPAGFPVQSGESFRPDMVSELKNELSRRTGRKDPYLGVVHRLDQPVEGLLVFARTERAAADLSRQLQDGRMQKRYLAVLADIPSQKRGICIDYLKKDGRNNLSGVVSKEVKGAKRAELFYEILAVQENGEQDNSPGPDNTGNGTALVEIELKTGRHHQIRVQMAHRKCPLVGDMKYNQDKTAKNGLALCAYFLELENPGTKKRQCFVTAPESPAFRSFAGEILDKISAEASGGS